MLILVATVASATALYVAWAEVSPDPDSPVTMLLTVVLTGLAVGAWRRASPIGVMVQIALACAALRLADEVMGTRLSNYMPVALFAATVVVPLLIVRALEASGREGRRRERVAAVAAVLINTGLNLGAFVAFLVMENESGMMPFPISTSRMPTIALPVPPGPPIQFSSPPLLSPSAPTPAEASPLMPGGADEPLLSPSAPVPAEASPLMPDEPQLIPLEPGSDPLDKLPPLDMPPNIPAPAPAPAPKSK